MRKAEELTADVLHLERRLEGVDRTTDPADLEAFQWSRTLFNIFRCDCSRTVRIAVRAVRAGHAVVLP